MFLYEQYFVSNNICYGEFLHLEYQINGVFIGNAYMWGVWGMLG